MRRRRKIGKTVTVIAILFFLLMLGAPALVENYQVIRFFNTICENVRDKNRDVFTQYYYKGQLMNYRYLDQLFKYSLCGWKITGIGGQPYPMESFNAMNIISADLYYRLPDNLVAPRGKYRKINHPRYGPCAVVPVKIEFAYRTDHDPPWFLPIPEFMTGQNWLAPFEKPL